MKTGLEIEFSNRTAAFGCSRQVCAWRLRSRAVLVKPQRVSTTGLERRRSAHSLQCVGTRPSTTDNQYILSGQRLYFTPSRAPTSISVTLHESHRLATESNLLMLVNVTVLAHAWVGSAIRLYSTVQMLPPRSGSRIESSSSVHEQGLPLLQGQVITWEEVRRCGKEDQDLDLGNETSANSSPLVPHQDSKGARPRSECTLRKSKLETRPKTCVAWC